MKTISRDEVNLLLVHDDVAVVDVLEQQEYSDSHLPAAVNVPWSEHFSDDLHQAVPWKKTPVVVYGKDRDCDLAAKASQALEDDGYVEVYEYAAAKADWQAAGLPLESQ